MSGANGLPPTTSWSPPARKAEQWAAGWYAEHGFALTPPFAPGTKGPTTEGWNKPGGYITDPKVARQLYGPGGNMGAVLAPSDLVVLDVDAVEPARIALAAVGLDLDAMLAAGCQSRGNPEHAKAFYRVPKGTGESYHRHALKWPARPEGGKPPTVIELRGGPVQDVLPPSRHEAGHVYTWLGDPAAIPELPSDLRLLWSQWAALRPALLAACPWAPAAPPPPPRRQQGTSGASIIDTYNATHTVEELLKKHDYKCIGSKYLSPTSDTGMPGVVIFPDTGHCYSHHASDPLGGEHAHDAFSVYTVLDHDGDQRAAVKAAAVALGLDRPRLVANSKKPATPPPDESPLFLTPRALVASSPPEVEWIARGFVARGAMTELAGKVKTAGKTTAMLALLKAMERGGWWWGAEVRPGRAVLLTEQGRRSLGPALQRAGLAEAEHVSMLLWPEHSAIQWPDRVALAVAEAERSEAAVLVVDTVSRHAGVKDEQSAADADEAMGPLQVAAAGGLGVVLVRHERKAGGDVGESGRGSTAFSGAVDIIVRMQRLPGDAAGSNLRLVETLSRFGDETPDTITVELRGHSYDAVDDGRHAALAAAALAFIAEHPGCSQNAVVEAGGKRRGAMLAAVESLMARGSVVNVSTDPRRKALEVVPEGGSRPPEKDPPGTSLGTTQTTLSRPAVPMVPVNGNQYLQGSGNHAPDVGGSQFPNTLCGEQEPPQATPWYAAMLGTYRNQYGSKAESGLDEGEELPDVC